MLMMVLRVQPTSMVHGFQSIGIRAQDSHSHQIIAINSIGFESDSAYRLNDSLHHLTIQHIGHGGLMRASVMWLSPTPLQLSLVTYVVAMVSQ